MSIHTIIPALLLLLAMVRAFAQSAPVSPDHASRFTGEQQIEDEAKQVLESRFSLESDRTYTLAELVNLAEEHNPETRVAWESARAQLGALGIARSELYPTVAVVVLSEIERSEALLGSQFYRQTVQRSDSELDLNYTVFDFAGAAGRGAARRAAFV